MHVDPLRQPTALGLEKVTQVDFCTVAAATSISGQLADSSVPTA